MLTEKQDDLLWLTEPSLVVSLQYSLSGNGLQQDCLPPLGQPGLGHTSKALLQCSFFVKFKRWARLLTQIGEVKRIFEEVSESSF